MTLRGLLLGACAFSAGALGAGCSDDSVGATNPFLIACSDKVDDVYQLPTGLPAYDSSHRGDVFRCAFDKKMTAAQINKQALQRGYVGPALTSGASVFRIGYRTERSSNQDGALQAGYSSALVLIPDTPRQGAMVIPAHGTAGEADRCAPSLADPLDSDATADDTALMNLAFAGYGYVVIAPDYGGYGYGQIAHGWALAADEAHVLLDATRAMSKLLPAAKLPSKSVFVGHSQGGHAVLSTHGLAKSYGMSGSIGGVVGFAPLWYPAKIFAAAETPAGNLTTKDDGYFLAYTMYYFYGHGELYDGPGGGLAMFQADKREQIKTLLTTGCNADVAAGQASLGTVAPDYWDNDFINDVGFQCGVLDTCTSDLGKLWHPRFVDDRPAIDTSGPPILIWQGKADTTVPPNRAQCGFDKINGDIAAAGSAATVEFNVCGDSTATHLSVVQNNLYYVNQWIDATVNGAPSPSPCPGLAGIEDNNTPIICAMPPTNSD